MNRHFRFQLKDDKVRGMNREQYRAASRFARLSARLVESSINWDRLHKHLSDALLFGYSRVGYKDLLK